MGGLSGSGGPLKLPFFSGLGSLGSLNSPVKLFFLDILLKLFPLNLNGPAIPPKPLLLSPDGLTGLLKPLLGLGGFIRLLKPFLLGLDNPNKLLKLPLFKGFTVLPKSLLCLL